MKYFSNLISAYEVGAQLDIRFRLAVENIKAHAPALGQSPEDFAKFHLDAATALVDLAEDRGLALPLPDDDQLPKGLRLHLRRNIRQQVYQQAVGAEIGAEEMPSLQRAPLLPPGRGPQRN